MEPIYNVLSRPDCAKAGLHGVGTAGIHGSKANVAYSICVSGGYEHNIDDGDWTRM
jgi:SAD/SRA domain